jgi:hypothetical protein
LEAVFLCTRNPEDLEPVYRALIKAGRVLLSAYQKKKGFRLGAVRAGEVVEDAATRLLEMYLKHDDQKSIPLSSRMHWEILYQLHNPQRVRADQVATVDERHPANRRQDQTDQAGYIAAIVADDRVDGKKIIVDLYRYKRYKPAILAIARYTRQEWIRQHAVELHTIWQTLRGK